VELGRFEVGAPKDKLMLGGTWTVGSFAFSATGTRYGEFTVRNALPIQDQTFGSEWTLDLSGTYTIDRWAFTLGADNVLDAYPDDVLLANSTSGQLPYSGSAPFGFNGAYLYLNARYSW